MTIEEVLQDEALKERLASVKNLEEAVGLLQEKGLDVTEKDIEAALAPETDGELDESALEDVSGGAKASKLLDVIRKILIPILPTPIILPINPWHKK